MKLRRAIPAMATVAALTALGPITLLTSAPTALADTPASTAPSSGTPTPPSTPPSSPAPSDPSGTPTDTGTDVDPGNDTGTGSTGGPGTDPTPTPSPTKGTTVSAAPRGPGPATSPTSGPAGSAGSGTDSDSGGATKPGGDWSPGQCTDFQLDDGLSVRVTGLPGHIVAGSGWHPFTFSVANHTQEHLKNIYVQSFTEYESGVNEQDSLQLDLAQLQFLDPADGQWTSAYQDFYQDGPDKHPYTGTFVADVPDLGVGQHIDLRLRVRIDASAPAGAGFALSTAVYAGQGSSCNLNGDTYDFTVLKAGSEDPGDVGDAQPTGAKPTPDSGGSRPQGGVHDQPINGSLAGTGTSSAVPVIGLIGALAVIVGSVTVYAARRRALAQATAHMLAPDDMAGADEAAGTQDAAGADEAAGTGPTPADDRAGTDEPDEADETATDEPDEQNEPHEPDEPDDPDDPDDPDEPDGPNNPGKPNDPDRPGADGDDSNSNSNRS